MGTLLAQLGHIPKEDRRREVALDVSLLERLDLTGENMVEPESKAVLRLDRLSHHAEREQRRLGATNR
jgi:hypothetical protein